MRVLMAHNFYQLPGGEDSVFRAEVDNLRNHGIDVDVVTRTNDEIRSSGDKLVRLLATTYDKMSFRIIKDRINYFQPDVVHLHNFFPLLSLSAHQAAFKSGLPVVQTLHNYRLLCANGLLFRNQRTCESCIEGTPLTAVYHRCYRSSLAGSLSVVAMQNAARKVLFGQRGVDRFIALTTFAATTFQRAGLPSDRISIKPNFVHSDAMPPSHPRKGFLYVGRLSQEKGLATLIRAWSQLPEHQLRIIGSGPLESSLRSVAPSNVTFLGHKGSEDVKREMEVAAALIVPSQWYEGFPMVVVEAFSRGLPVLASDLGSLSEIVDRSRGDHFISGDAESLITCVKRNTEGDALQQKSAGALNEYRKKYTAEVNFETQMAIYQEAQRRRREMLVNQS